MSSTSTAISTPLCWSDSPTVITTTTRSFHKSSVADPVATPSTACDVDSFIVDYEDEKELLASPSSSSTASNSSDSDSLDENNSHNTSDNDPKRTLFDNPSTSTSLTSPVASEHNTAAAAANSSTALTVTAIDNASTVTATVKKSKKTKKNKIWKAAAAVTPRWLRRSSLLPSSSKHATPKANQMSHSVMTNGGPPETVLQWLEAVCSDDLVPKVLAFLPPPTTQALMQTNRYWFHLIARNDGTWRTLCERLYKVCLFLSM